MKLWNTRHYIMNSPLCRRRFTQPILHFAWLHPGTTCTLKVPVLDNWWQTETAHAITSTCVGLGNSLEPPKDVTGVPLPGFDGEFEVWRFHLDSYRITQSKVKLTMSNLKRYSYEQNEMMRYAGIWRVLWATSNDTKYISNISYCTWHQTQHHKSLHYFTSPTHAHRMCTLHWGCGSRGYSLGIIFRYVRGVPEEYEGH